MTPAITIPKGRPAETGLDQSALYALGLARVQDMAGRIWTDYNVHDPGVTTLELLCYALTDLSYRASLPIQDLLASETDNAAEMQKQFPSAARILPNRPLTVIDYRKLLIDLPGVKNAWVTPAVLSYYANTIEGSLSQVATNAPGEKEVPLRGLYDVLIDFMEDIQTEAQQTVILTSVGELLQANRNLCEDFVSFSAVEGQSFLLCCELELTPEAEVAAVEAQILFQVQQYLAPAVPNYSLDEMLQRLHPDGTPFTVDEIFDGPLLSCGFIDDDELAAGDLQTEIYLSDVIRIIMEIDGVQAIRDIIVSPEIGAVAGADKWVVPITAGSKAVLNSAKSRMVFYKGKMPVTAADDDVTEQLSDLAAAARAKTETIAVPRYDLGVPLGTYRQLDSYYSFQNDFPALYGLSEQGLSGAVGAERQATAFQLKAYLLFYDQIMANYFMQLSRVKDLLSTDPKLEQTYFAQVVDSFADYERIYADNPLDSLNDVIEDQAGFAERRNRFLDHLIARFAEQLTDLVNILASAFNATPAQMIGVRCDFLQNYPAISSERALAYNYSLQDNSSLWDSSNVSGFERRLARLLGLRNSNRRNLKDITYDNYAQINPTPDNQFRWSILDRTTDGVMLSSSGAYATTAAAQEEMQLAISSAQVPAGYQRKTTTAGQYYFNIVDLTSDVVGRRIEYFDTSDEMEEAISELMIYLQTNYSDEGMYLIESILLRPDEDDDPFLPICPDPGCKDCADDDPYSYRINIILPAYSSRFSNMDFRFFCEEIIRAETPAHILPRICWVSQDDMATLEKSYQDWLSLKAGADKNDRATKLSSFIDALFAARNVYPTQYLHECDSPASEPKFILGRTALGTLTDNSATT